MWSWKEPIRDHRDLDHSDDWTVLVYVGRSTQDHYQLHGLSLVAPDIWNNWDLGIDCSVS